MTDVGTLTLSDFLLARIAEDEGSAREAAEAAPGKWASWNHRAHSLDLRDLASPEAGRIAEILFGADDHIARHDPARVLAECEAKRRIVAEYAAAANVAASTRDTFAGDDGPRGRTERAASQTAERVWADAMRLLALPYADHPDYRSDWAV